MPYYTVLVDISYEFYEDGATVYVPEDMISVVTADTTVSPNLHHEIQRPATMHIYAYIHHVNSETTMN